jgi:hypothetical protein
VNPWSIPSFLLLTFLMAGPAFAMHWQDFRRSNNIQDDRGLGPQVIIKDFNQGKDALERDILRVMRLPKGAACPALGKIKSNLQDIHARLGKAEKLESILPLHERDFASETYVRGAEVNMTNDLDTLGAAIEKEDWNLSSRQTRFNRSYELADRLAKASRKRLGDEKYPQGTCGDNVYQIRESLNNFNESVKHVRTYFKDRRDELIGLIDSIERSQMDHSLASIGTGTAPAVATDPSVSTAPAAETRSTAVTPAPKSKGTGKRMPASGGSDFLLEQSYNFYRDFIQPEQSP